MTRALPTIVQDLPSGAQQAVVMPECFYRASIIRASGFPLTTCGNDNSGLFYKEMTTWNYEDHF
jgi:hypothetical protein